MASTACRSVERSFCLAAILILVTQLLSPFAFAATPTPSTTPSPSPAPTSVLDYPPDFDTAAGACTANRMTDQERQTLWDNTIANPVRQITDVPLDQLLVQNQTLQAVNPIAQNAPVNPLAPQAVGVLDQKVSLDTLSRLASIPKEKLVQKYVKGFNPDKDKVDDVAANTFVTYAQAQVIARETGGETAADKVNSVISQLSGILGTQVKETEAKLPEEEFFACAGNKITLPDYSGKDSGREISCPQLMAQISLNPQSCLLQGNIKGRVSIEANLDKDLTYGSVSSAVLEDKDVFAPTGEEEKSQPNDNTAQHLSGDQVAALLSLNGGGNILIPSFYQSWIQTTAKVNKADFYVSLLAGFASFAGTSASARQLTHLKEERQFLTTRVDSLQTQILHAPPGTPPPAALSAELAEYQATLSKTEKQVNTYTNLQGATKVLGGALVTRQGISLAYGMGWLATARFLYEVNDRLLMLMSGTEGKYVKVYASKPVAEEFRQKTSPWNLATLLEKIGVYSGGGLGVPPKAFNAGTIRLINVPGDLPQASKSSSTSISLQNAHWNIATNWQGRSSAINFEDTRSFRPKVDAITSLPFKTNNAFPGAVLHQRAKADIAATISKLAVPFLISRAAFGYSNLLGIGAAVLGTSYILEDPPINAGDKCDPAELAEYKKLYITWVSSSYASIFIQTAFTYGIPHVAPVATVILIAVSEAANNYFQAKQFQINAQAIEYTSLCQDQQYKVLSYQALKPQATGDTGKTKVDSTLSGLSDLTKSIAAGLFSKPQDDKARLAGFQELLNLRSEITNQKGFIQSPEVFYVHVEQSPSMMPTHLFDQLNGNGCKLSENDVLSNGDVLQIENGLRLVKPDGTTAFDFNSFYWQLRAASILRSQELARMIIPNTIITTQLACGDKPFISITPAGSGSLVDKSCPAGDCLARQLNALVKFDGISLEQVLGKITSVDTDLGTVSFLGNSISFTRFSLGENAGEKPGVETRSPSLDYLASSGLGTSTAGSSLDVLGNANVVLNAPAGDFGKMDVGSLKTIIAEKGKIEYDPVAKRLYVFVYVLGEGQAQTIADVVARPSQVNIPGEAPIPAINLQLQGKTGFEDVVRQLQDSLDQVQKDSTGGKGGFQVLETPDSIYYLFDNTLRKIDKATGQQQDFHLTGSPTTGPDGSIIFPTDKGPITIKPGVDDKGQPIITVNGPGFKDEGPLESAKGPSGIFTFNPSTGAITVYNGQDIPMDPRFATQGMGFTGTPDGTVGLPTQNPFLLPPAPSDDGFNRKTSLSLPAWPENPVYFTLMLGIVLVGIAFVRRKHS